MIRGRFFHPGSLRGRDLVGFKDHFGDLFVHGKGTAKRTWTRIADTEDIKGCLKLSILPTSPWSPINTISASRHSSITLAPKSSLTCLLWMP